ncbi:MAG: tetratricopeptide repeat protein [Bacillota bacterium]
MRTRITRQMLAFVLVVSVTLIMTGSVSLAQTASFDQAMTYFNQGDYQAAADEFVELIESGEETWQNYYYAGLSYNNMGQAETAIPYFESAHELRPEDYRTVVNYSRSLYRTGSYQSSLDLLDEYEGEILDSQYHNLIGLNHLDQGNLEEAEAAFQSALEFEDNLYVYNNLGLLMLQQGQYEEARDYLAQAVELDPDVPYVYNNYGLALLNTENYEEAREAFLQALEIDSNYTKAENNLDQVENILAE